MWQAGLGLIIVGALGFLVGPFMAKADAKTNAKLLGADNPASNPRSKRSMRISALVIAAVGAVLLIVGLLSR